MKSSSQKQQEGAERTRAGRGEGEQAGSVNRGECEVGAQVEQGGKCLEQGMGAPCAWTSPSLRGMRRRGGGQRMH